MPNRYQATVSLSRRQLALIIPIPGDTIVRQIDKYSSGAVTMGRKASRPQHIEPEDESQDYEEPEAAPPEAGDDSPGRNPGGPVSKSEAARQALAAGLEGPEEATGFIRQRFGIEMSRQHFSAVKSQLRKKGGGASAPGRRGRKKKQVPPPEATPQIPPAIRPSTGQSSDLIDSLETLKPLIAQYGAEKVKRLVDLLG